MKKILLVILIVFMTITVSTQTVWDGTIEIWTKGSGTKTDPYHIETAKQLAYLSNSTNEGRSYKNIYFIQTNDIDLGGKSERKWTSIGNSKKNGFKGSFDGNKKEIFNLYINCGNESEVGGVSGLFGYVDTGVIKNVAISGESIIYGSTVGAGYVGAIVGLAEYAEVRNCSSFATVYVYPNTTDKILSCGGGIVGYAKVTPVSGCKNYGNVFHYYDNDNPVTTYYSCVGGVVGYMAFANANLCCNYGNVGSVPYSHDEGILSCSYTGGVVGYMKGSVVMDCYNVGDISYNAISMEAYIGGIAGATFNNSDGYDEIKTSISQCYNKGRVITSNALTSYVSGITGKNEGSGIEACYNEGEILCINDLYNEGMAFVGGIEGYTKQSLTLCCYNKGAVKCVNVKNVSIGGVFGETEMSHRVTSTVSNSYNVGLIQAINVDSVNIGGILGVSRNIEAIVKNTYMLKNMIYVDEIETEGNNFGEQRSSEEMKSLEFIDELNKNLIKQLWIADKEPYDNDGYPILNYYTNTFDLDELLDMNVMIYPNPAKETISIDGGFSSLELYNISGQLLKTVEYSEHINSKINISAIKKGIYLIKIYDGNKSCTRKLVKQ